MRLVVERHCLVDWEVASDGVTALQICELGSGDAVVRLSGLAVRKVSRHSFHSCQVRFSCVVLCCVVLCCDGSYLIEGIFHEVSTWQPAHTGNICIGCYTPITHENAFEIGFEILGICC